VIFNSLPSVGLEPRFLASRSVLRFRPGAVWTCLPRDLRSSAVGIYARQALEPSEEGAAFCRASALGCILRVCCHSGFAPSPKYAFHLRPVLISSVRKNKGLFTMCSLVRVAETKGCALLAGNEGRPLRRMWLRLILFLLPIFVFLGPTIYAVDPYALFQHRSVVPDDVRPSYGLKVNSVLWKLIAYDRRPEPNIMLGDSQMDHLPAAAVSSTTGESYTNLAYSGGSLREPEGID